MHYIHAGQVLTQNGWMRDVQIDIGNDGRIVAIGPKSGGAGQTIDIALAAPTNLHSHTFQRAMAGLTEAKGKAAQDSFWTWRRLMYRFLEQLTPDHVESIAALVFMEMQEAGYGSVAEFHYLHHDLGGTPYANPAEMTERIVSAAQQAGIGLTLLPVLYQFGGCDHRALAGGQMRFGTSSDGFEALYCGAAKSVAQSLGDHKIGAAAHSLRAVDQAGLDFALTLCPDGPFHMHVAEQVGEVDEVQSHLGARPVEWLLHNYPVDQRWCFIHATQMTSQETQALAMSGAVVGLCPITESNLGDGIFNGLEYISAGGRVGFGSDSNIHVSLFDELKTLEYSQRLHHKSRAVLAAPDRSTGRVLFDLAAAGGAQAAGRNAGAIAVGMQADILGISSNNQWLCSRSGDAILDSLIFGGRGQECISDVWSAGRHMVTNGRHINRNAIIDAFKLTISELGQEI